MFNENLQILRKEKGFSQEQLAVRLNVVRQTISKWEKGLSVPDAEMLIQLAEVLNVSVSDLLGKEIQIEEKQNELDVIALELSKLNELLATYGGKASQWKKKIGKIVGTIIIIIIFLAIYESWTEMFREFGVNLYHMING